LLDFDMKCNCFSSICLCLSKWLSNHG